MHAITECGAGHHTTEHEIFSGTLSRGLAKNQATTVRLSELYFDFAVVLKSLVQKPVLEHG